MKVYGKGCLVLALALFTSCQQAQKAETNEPAQQTTFDVKADRRQVNYFLDEWHDDAANARPAYFHKIAEDGIYIGTDKTELWKKDEFQEWSKKYFDQGKGWDFDAVDRNIYFSKDGSVVWFDELLDTWMGAARGSGVLSRNGDAWEIEHYHLGISIPNDTLKTVMKVVEAYEQNKPADTGAEDVGN